MHRKMRLAGAGRVVREGTASVLLQELKEEINFGGKTIDVKQSIQTKTDSLQGIHSADRPVQKSLYVYEFSLQQFPWVINFFRFKKN